MVGFVGFVANEFSHWWFENYRIGLRIKKAQDVRFCLLFVTLLFYYWSGTRGALVAFVLSIGGWFLLHVPQSLRHK